MRARALVKDERHLDRFDQVFGHVFKGLELMADAAKTRRSPKSGCAAGPALPVRRRQGQDRGARRLGKDHGGAEEAPRRSRKAATRAATKWIGTGGTSPYGAYGYNPAGVRIGQKESRQRRAIKVWDKREFKDLDEQRRARHPQHQGRATPPAPVRARRARADELDLDGTIKGTAHKGYLDIHMRPERRNTVKVLMFFDIGGSMDWHIKTAEELFSAARTEFKHLEYFYFHNCLYEFVWKDNARRWTERTSDLGRCCTSTRPTTR